MGRRLIFNYFLILLISAKALPSLAIDHANELKKAQSWANSFENEYPIVLFNRDEFHFLFLKNNATVKSKEGENKRIKIISEYILKQTGLKLTRNELLNYETYLFTLTSSAVAVPFFESSAKNSKHKLCAVFANAPNGNSRIEIERLTGLENEKVYEDKNYDQIVIKEDFETMYLFSLYHEVSHCLDQFYLPKVYQTYEPTAHGIHQAESFAETLAYLHLAKTLDPQIAKARMLYRTLYSRVIGEFFAQNPSVAFGDANILAGGAIYYLTPVLSESLTLIQSRQIQLNDLTNQELYQIASKIVDERSIDYRSIAAIVRSLEDTESVLKNYQELAFTSPEFFLRTYEDLVSYLAITDLWFQQAFDKSLGSKNQVSLLESLELPIEEICRSIKEDQLDVFLKLINSFRDSVDLKDSSVMSRKARYNELNNLTQTLNSSCHL